jgi:glycosyltransferase involved in cell wall biosynthesis
LVICNDGDYFLRHRLFVVDRLVSMGHDVTVLTGGNPIRADLVVGWHYQHVPVERFRFAPYRDFALMLHSAKVISYLKPDAIHLITLKAAVFSGLASVIVRVFSGYPRTILITLPGLGRIFTSPKDPRKRKRPFAAALTLSALRLIAKCSAAQFSFETWHDCEFFESRGIVNQKNSAVIEGAGVDTNQFRPSTAGVRHIKKRILFAGRLLKSKGLGVFLATARELSGRDDVEFLVAGTSDDKDPDSLSSEDLAQLSYVRFLGMIEDMPNLLRDCDVVCLPTRYGEGIPRILIEAAATGLASIASNHPGCQTIVVEGETGQILHGRSDAEMARELSAAVLRYLDAPELLDRHKHAAYEHFRLGGFSEDTVVKRFCDLLDAAS